MPEHSAEVDCGHCKTFFKRKSLRNAIPLWGLGRSQPRYPGNHLENIIDQNSVVFKLSKFSIIYRHTHAPCISVSGGCLALSISAYPTCPYLVPSMSVPCTLYVRTLYPPCPYLVLIFVPVQLYPPQCYGRT